MPTPRHPLTHWSTVSVQYPAIRICQRWGLTVYVAAALLGVLSAPLGVTLLNASVLTVCVVSAYVAGYRAWQRSWPATDGLRACGSVTFALPLFVEGIRVLGKIGSLVAWVLPTLALVLVAVGTVSPRSAAAAGGAWAHARPPVREGVKGDAYPRMALAAMPIEVLFGKWRAIQDEQQRVLRPGEVEAMRWVRGLIIDELQRRDPTGIDGWLAEGAAAPPEHYIGSNKRREC